MFTTPKPDLQLSKREKANAIRQELHNQKEQAAQQALFQKLAEEQKVNKVRELQQELELAKAARERRKAESVGRRPKPPLRVSKQLQDTGRLVLEEESSKRLPSSLDNSYQPQSSESPSRSAHTQQALKKKPVRPPGVLTPKQARAMVSTRIKAYAARVKQEFKPTRDERKQLQMDLLRDQQIMRKPPKLPRVRLLEIV